MRVTILKQTFSKIIKSRLQQGSRGANSVATISECADEIYFVLARSERIPFGVKTCESLLPVDRCYKSVVGAAFDKVSKKGFSMSCSSSMVNLILW